MAPYLGVPSGMTVRHTPRAGICAVCGGSFLDGCVWVHGRLLCAGCNESPVPLPESKCSDCGKPFKYLHGPDWLKKSRCDKCNGRALDEHRLAYTAVKKTKKGRQTT